MNMISIISISVMLGVALKWREMVLNSELQDKAN